MAPIRLPPGHGELEFYYTALSFRAPERNRFKYKLEGVNADWVEAGSRRVAYYDNLSPGKYVFRVLACNNNGIWNEEGAVAEIVLLPHAWQTWWFKLGMGAIAALAFVGAHRMRLSRLRDIDRLRLRLAADLHDDVGSNLSTISLLTRRVQKQRALGESTAEDLAAIHRISRQSGSAIREIIWLINPEYDTMKDLVTRMRELADSFLTGLEYNFQGPPVDWSHKLNLQFRQNIFLLYKETLTNVARSQRYVSPFRARKADSRTDGRGLHQEANRRKARDQFSHGQQSVAQHLRKVARPHSRRGCGEGIERALAGDVKGDRKATGGLRQPYGLIWGVNWTRTSPKEISSGEFILAGRTRVEATFLPDFSRSASNSKLWRSKGRAVNTHVAPPPKS